MEGIYFKKRKNFDFSPHKFDLGAPFFQKRSHLDRHFINKIVSLDSSDHIDFYDYHVNYFSRNKKNKEAAQKEFLTELSNLLEIELNKEQRRDTISMNSRKRAINNKRISQYRSFIEVIKKERDYWGLLEDKETAMIKSLRKEIKKLKAELGVYKIKPQHKIQIMSDEKAVFIDILHQFQNLKHWKRDGTDLLITHSHRTWAKILANYFSFNGKDISLHTVDKHFKEDEIGKYHEEREYEVKLIEKQDK